MLIKLKRIGNLIKREILLKGQVMLGRKPVKLKTLISEITQRTLSLIQKVLIEMELRAVIICSPLIMN
ncbi:hypothetical protein CN679_02590 [Bacillus pseudomycoides]|nr:hypothetical protein COO02_17625 [Bacillus pseudomycoides]PEI95633.1 hypothetical protein CN679_02590 [Bacillus pseudomycoides]